MNSLLKSSLALLVALSITTIGLAGKSRYSRHAKASGAVLLFVDSDFRGEALVFDGSGSIPRLDEFPYGPSNWNDQVSSVVIEGPYEVTLYEHAYFQGRSIRIDGSVTNIKQLLHMSGRYENWNDIASSLTIERKRYRRDHGPADSPLPASVLYTHSSFRGEELALYEGQSIPHLGEIGWNDRASSLTVEPGYILILYEHSNYRGQSIRLDGQQSNLNWARDQRNRSARWNDRASSLQVIKAR